MNPLPRLSIALLISAFCGLLAPSGLLESRTWTNQEGRSIEADFIELKDGKVGLRMNGKRYDVPLESLSPEDQAHAKEEAERMEAAAAKEALRFMGQDLVKGRFVVLTHPLSKENRRLAARGGSGWDDSFVSKYSGTWLREMAKEHDLERISVAIGLPDDFDPAVGCPIFVQWTTSDSKSNVNGAKRYWDDCRAKGWMLVSVEGSPDPKATWSNAVFYAGIKEFFERLHEKYEGSEEWPVATGGFSGGAKISQWMGGLMAELDGVDFRGFWLGGCNEALFDFAIEDLSVSKRSFRNKKAYISSGDSDRLVSDRYREIVEDGADAVGLEVRSETYAGGHSVDRSQFKEALDWFLE